MKKYVALISFIFVASCGSEFGGGQSGSSPRSDNVGSLHVVIPSTVADNEDKPVIGFSSSNIIWSPDNNETPFTIVSNKPLERDVDVLVRVSSSSSSNDNNNGSNQYLTAGETYICESKLYSYSCSKEEKLRNLIENQEVKLFMGDQITTFENILVPLKAGTTSRTIKIKISQETLDEIAYRGAFSISILSTGSTAYTINAVENSIFVSRVPIISIASENGESSNEELKYKIRSTNVLEHDCSIAIAISETGRNFVPNTFKGVKTVTIPAGSMEAEYLLPLNSDEVRKSTDSLVSARLLTNVEAKAASGGRQSQCEYLLTSNESNKEASIHVDSDNVAKIYVYAVEESIAEGETAEFMIGGEKDLIENDLSVKIRTTQLGNYIEGALPTVITVPADTGVASLKFETVDDDFFATDGNVVVEIVDEPGYNPHDVMHSAKIDVANNDEFPILSISPYLGTIDRMEDLKFVISARSESLQPVPIPAGLSVNYLLNLQNGEDEVEESLQLDSKGGDSEEVIGPFIELSSTLNLNDKDVIATIRLLDDTENNRYSVDDGQYEASVLVIENDQEAQLRISATTSQVHEGAAAEFEIRSSNQFVDLSVRLEMESEGDFLSPDIWTNREIRLPKDQAGQSSIAISLDTVDDRLREDNGSVTVKVLPGYGYSTVSELSNWTYDWVSSTVDILDNDTTIVFVDSVQSSIEEGAIAEFLIEREGGSIAEDLTVMLSLSIRGGVEVEWNASDSDCCADRFVLTGGNHQGTYRIQVIDDQFVAHGNGSLVMTVHDGLSYTAKAGSSSATIAVTDNDSNKPQIYVEALTQHVVEGETAEFEIGADNLALESDIDINLEFFTRGDFLAETLPDSFTLEMGESKGTLGIATVDDGINEADGVLYVRLLTGAGYAISQDLRRTASIEIRDNETKPSVYITSLASSITVGELAEFEIGVDGEGPRSDLTVNLNVTRHEENGSYTRNRKILLPSDSTSVTLRLQNYFSGTKRISVEIAAGSGYVQSESSSSASIKVSYSDAKIPRLSIAPLLESIVYGTEIRFIVSARTDRSDSTVIPSGLSISLELSPDVSGTEVVSSNYVLTGGSSEETIRPFEFSYNGISNSGVTVVSAKILEDENGSSYVVDETQNAATVSVLEDKSENITQTVTISAKKSDVYEGEPAEFVFQTDNQKTDLLVKLETTVTGDFVANGTGNVTEIALPKNIEEVRSIDLRIDTIDDSVSEENGSVTVKILTGFGYVTNANESLSASVNIHDNDTTIVYIESVTESVDEGEYAEFLIGIEGALPNSDLYINLRISQTEEILPDEFVNQRNTNGCCSDQFELRNGNRQDYYSIPTADDGYFYSNAKIAVDLFLGQGYAAKLGTSRAEVALVDNDGNKPFIYIEAVNGQIEEGRNAEFRIGSSTIAPVVDIAIGLEFTQNGDFLHQNLPENYTLKSGQKIGSFGVGTIDDEVAESDGRVQARLVPGTGYSLSDDQTTSASVNLSDNEPRIEVRVSENEIEEGETAEFEIATTNGALEESIEINLESSASADILIETLPETFTLSRGLESDILSIPTFDDGESRPDGNINLIIVPGDQYWIGEEASASITILDNDEKPVASVGFLSSLHNRSGNMEIVVSLDSNGPKSDYEVWVDLTGHGTDCSSTDTRRLRVPVPSSSSQVVHTVHSSMISWFECAVRTSATVVEGDDGYDISDTNGVANVELVDEPIISISPYGETQIYEGEDAEFLFESALVRKDLNINFEVGQSGDFLGSSLPESMQWNSGLNQKLLEIETIDDDQIEPDGFVSVSIKSGNGYIVSPDGNDTARIEVFDNDLPRILVEGTTTSIEEGEPAEFRIGAEGDAPESDIEISLATVVIGDFFSVDLPSSFILRGGVRNRLLSLDTDDDEVLEPDGSITVRVLAGSGYVFYQNGSQTSSIEILDNDHLPRISIGYSNSTIVEGETAEFVIQTGVVLPKADIEIGLDFDTYGNYIQQALPESATLASGQSTAYVRIVTVDDELSSPDGFITANILSGAEYRVQTSSSTITIRGNEMVPEFYIESVYPEFSPRGFALFEIGVTTDFSRTDFILNLLIASEETWFTFYHTESIRFPSSITSGIYRVQTGNNSRKVSISLLAGKGYTVSETRSRASVVLASKPTMSVVFSGTQIIEGESVSFSIRKSMATANNITVNVSIVQQGEFLKDDPIETVVVPAGDRETTIPLDTIDDEINERNGTISVSILSGDDYLVSSEPNNAKSLNVSDNDTPVVTIEAVDARLIEEENTLQFSISATLASDYDLNVGVSVTDLASVISGTAPTSATISAGSTVTKLGVSVNEGATDSVAVELSTSSSGEYTVGTPNSATSQLPEVSIPAVTIANAEAVVEGIDTHASFPLTLSQQIASNITVNVSVTGSTEFITSGNVPTTVDIVASNLTAVLEIPIDDDEVDEEDGIITVEISTSANETAFTLGSGSTATANVQDDDDPPSISITGPTGFVEGSGEYAAFILTASNPASVSRTVNLAITGATNFILSNPVPNSAELPVNSLTTMVKVEIDDDSVNDESGEIVVEISDPSNSGDYVIGTPGSVTMPLADNDLSSSLPEISIVSSLTDITVGVQEELSFTVITTSTFPTEQEIQLSVTGVANFVASENVPSSVTLPANESSANLTLPIVNDEVYDDEEAVTATLTSPDENALYSLSSLSSATVKITDNHEPPTITILGKLLANESDGNITLLVHASREASSSRTVNISVTGDTNFLLTDEVPATVTIPANSITAELEIPLDDDEVEEENGTVTVSIAEPTMSNYIVGAASEVSVEVRDDDGTGRPVESHSPALISIPLVSVSAISPSVVEGSTAEFQVSVSNPQAVDLTALISVEGSHPNEDETSQESLLLKAGNYATKFEVSTFDDNIIREDRYVSVVILKGSGYLVDEENSFATIWIIENAEIERRNQIEAANRTILPALLQKVGSNPIRTTARRVNQAFAGKTQSFTIAGYENPKDIFVRSGEILNEGSDSLKSILPGTSFLVPQATQDGEDRGVAVWGSSELLGIAQSGDRFDWNGDLLVGGFGVDTRLSEDFLTGLSVSFSQADALYENVADSVFQYRTESTGFHPYMGWDSSIWDMGLHITAGYSESKITIEQKGYDSILATGDLFSAGVGGYSNLVTFESPFNAGKFKLNAKSEAWMAQQRLKDEFGYFDRDPLGTGLFRITSEGVSELETGTGNMFKQSVSFGVVDTIGEGAGLEFGSDVSYEDRRGISTSGSGRTLLELGSSQHVLTLSGQLKFDSDNDNLGINLSFSPNWSRKMNDESGAIWISETSKFGNSVQHEGTHSSLNAKIGYGFDIRDGFGILSPFGEMNLIESERNTFRIGGNFITDSDVEIRLEFVGSNPFDIEPSQEIKARSSIRW